MQEEIWKDLGAHKDYQVSNLGRIKSLKNNKEIILKLQSNYKGYLIFSLYNNGKAKTFVVHRLVASSFLGKSDLQVNHINGIKNDNRVENLEYVSNRENKSHQLKNTNKSSKYIGVHWYKNYNKWRCRIKINGKEKCLGYFENEIDARNAYLKALEENNLTNKYAI